MTARKTTRKRTSRKKATRKKTTGKAATSRGRRHVAWKAKFLEALAFDCNVRRSAEMAGTTRATAYRERGRDQSFRDAWDAALEEGYDRLEQEAHRRAVQGVEEPVIRKGQLVGYWSDADGNQVSESAEDAEFRPLTIRRYSDHLLLALLKAHRPAKYRERYEVTHKKDDDVDAEIKRLDAELTRLANGAPVPKE